VIKFPLLLLTTALGNALLNGMLAPLLGLNVRFRQSLMLVLMSFALASAILGAFAPLIAFIIWNTPPLSATESVPWTTYNFVQLVQVTAIAFAGVAANVRLRDLLQDLAGDRKVATKVLFAWLTGNLLLGSQLCWILRPFIGSPTLPVEFLRPTAFHGSFYETVFRALLRVLSLND
jgi:predicted membrane protein